MERKVTVIGLDGLSWELLTRLIEDNEVPNLERMIKSGTSAVLESTIPPVTGPAWVTFATGRDPGQHGVFDFCAPKDTILETTPVSSKAIQGPTFYELLEEAGMRSIIVNLPVSYPSRVHGILISSFLSPENEFFSPKGLVNMVPELREYRLTPKLTPTLARATIPKTEYIADLRDVEERRFRVAKKLYRMKWDFFFILFSSTDWLQHNCYDQLISGSDEGEKLYEDVDRYIGWILEHNPPNGTIFIMSDHGFRTYDKSFFINGWLRSERYLVFEESSEIEDTPYAISNKEWFEVGRTKIAVPPFVLANRFLYRLGKLLYQTVPWLRSFKVGLRKRPNVMKTSAFSLSTRGRFGSIYINSEKRFKDGIVSEDMYEDLRSEIIRKLRNLRDPNGRLVLKHVLTREEVYNGEFVRSAPDITLIAEDHIVDCGIYGAYRVFDRSKSNHHDREGVFVAYGEDVNRGFEIERPMISSMAPTILHILGLPIPEDMEADPLISILREDSEPFARPVRTSKVEETQRIRKRIRRLKERGKI